jgi:Uma2 family endonuclease
MARPPAIDTDTALWLALNVRSLGLTDDQLGRLFSDNEDFRFEMSAQGELIIMAPTTPKTDLRNVKITQRLANWTERDGTGQSFGSSVMFTFPNGAKRSPDGAWISNNRWNRVTEEEKDTFTNICPDFVIELRSKSDRLVKLKEKMDEYVDNGVRLGWLLDPLDNCAYIYGRGQSPERIESPTILSADPVLPGFEFDFREIL